MSRIIALTLTALALVCFAVGSQAADETDGKTAGTAKNNAALFDKLDANRDGFITADEVPQENRRLFDRLLRRGDKNGDGKLSREEFISAIAEDWPIQSGAAEGPERGGTAADGSRDRQLAGSMPGGSALPGGAGPFMGMAVFRALDTNGDGKLDAKEIAAAGDVLKKLVNKDGEITREELLKSLPPGINPAGGRAGRGPTAGAGGGLGEMTPEAALKRMMTQFDKNGDGKLQKDELPPRLAERFEELDTNHDGVLDEAEIKVILPRLIRRLPNENAPGGSGTGGGATGGPGAMQRQLRRLLIQDDAKPEEQKTDAK